MSQIIFILAVISIVAIIALSMHSMVSKKFDFFPPPSKNSWQYRVFWLLFRIMFLGVILISMIDFGSLQYVDSSLRYYLGVPLLALGFGAAFYLSFFLGWKNSHGEQQGLVTSGPFRWSRNPIYVVSIVGMVGWGIFVDSLFTYVLLACWSLLYIIAPFMEERWLLKKYGEQYAKYKRETSRFMGFPYKK